MTQRQDDAAAGYPTARWMREDPTRIGIPLFLQTQNRRAPAPGKLEALRAAWARNRADDPGAGRSDHRKPPSLSWEAWDALQRRDADEKKRASLERIAAMRAKKGLSPAGALKEKKEKTPRVIGYKGHIQGSRKARVHELFDLKGSKAAAALAAELGLKAGTVSSWIKSWG